MKWILIMWVYAGSGNGGVSLQQIPFENYDLCQTAKTAIDRETREAWSTPRLYCVQVKL